MLKRPVDLKVTGHMSIIEELEIVCCMMEIRQRVLVEHLGEGLYQFVKLDPG